MRKLQISDMSFLLSLIILLAYSNNESLLVARGVLTSVEWMPSALEANRGVMPLTPRGSGTTLSPSYVLLRDCASNTAKMLLE